MELKLRHTPDGKLVPDDPFLCEGTRLMIARADPDLGWSDDDIGMEGVITKEDILRTVRYREKKRNRLSATWKWRDGYEDYGAVTTEAVEVIE